MKGSIARVRKEKNSMFTRGIVYYLTLVPIMRTIYHVSNENEQQQLKDAYQHTASAKAASAHFFSQCEFSNRRAKRRFEIEKRQRIGTKQLKIA